MKKVLLLFIVLLVLVSSYFLLSSSGLIPFAITGEVPARLFVPSLGEVRCEAGQLSGIQTTKGYPVSVNSQFLLGSSYMSFDTVSSGVHPAIVSYTCNGADCQLAMGSDPKIHVSCNAGDFIFYKINKGNYTIGYNTRELVGGVTTEKKHGTYFNNTSVSFNENEAVTVQAVCWGNGYASSAGYVNLQYYVRQKVLRVYTIDGQYTNQETQGCLTQQIRNLTYSGQYNPTDKTVTWIDPRSNVTKTQSVNDLPSALNVGQTYIFFNRWQEISAVGLNIITDEQGNKYYVNRTFRTVYNVTTENTDSGSYLIASSIKLINPACVSNNDCPSGRQCSPEDNFTCQEIQGYCNYQSECGYPEYYSIGGQVYYRTWSCTSNQCVESSVLKNCNPQASYPVNGCSSDKPICDTTGSTCYAEVQQKLACPADCCIDSSTYYLKSCPSGYSCNSSGGLTGVCVINPINPFCGDGICQETLSYNERETNNFCSADCYAVDPLEEACAIKSASADGIFILGYDLRVQENSLLIYGQTITTCEPIYNWVAIIFGVVGIVGAGLIGYALISRKGGKK